MVRRTLVLCLLATALALSAARASEAKGYAGPESFRISGGDLPHPVVVSVAEFGMATSGQESWYSSSSGSYEPPPGIARYRVEIVDPAGGGAIEGFTAQEYVIGPPARMTSVDGTGWAEPIAPIRDLLDRYIDLDRRGKLTEHPTFAEAMAASREVFGASLTVNGQALDPSTTDQVLSLVGRAVPVRFGVRGRLIGQRNLRAVQLDVRFGDGGLTFAYVPPGAVARFGLLFNPRQLGNWEYVTMLDPPGYAQYAYTVPPEVDRIMRHAGFGGADEGELIESRAVPLDQAQLTFGEDHIEVWRGDGPHVRVAMPGDYDGPLPCSTADCARGPVPPFTGAPLNVEIWPRGVDPFPEAVLPAELMYYPGDASRSAHGVLVQTRGGAEFSGTFGGAQPPYYADATMDALLREAARELDRPRTHNHIRAYAVDGTAVSLGVLAIAWTSWDAERRRRSLDRAQKAS